MPSLPMERTGMLMAARIKATGSCFPSEFGTVKRGQVSMGEKKRGMGVMHRKIRCYRKPGNISKK